MAILNTEAIILRRHLFSESSLVASALTRDHGRIDFLAKGCRREKSLLYGHLDHYQREAVMIIQRSAGLDLITEAAFVDENAGLRFFPPAFAAAGFLAELVLAACLPGDPHPDLYDSLAKGFGFLSQLGEPSAKAGLAAPNGMMHREKLLVTGKVFRHLVLETLARFGFVPETRRCTVCSKPPQPTGNAMSRRHGGLVCASCRPHAGGRILGKNALNALQAATNGGESDERSLSDRERRELLRFLVDYCQYVAEKPLYSANPLFQLLRGEDTAPGFPG